jgi:pyrimidine deaminase RibD-like protein
MSNMLKNKILQRCIKEARENITLAQFRCKHFSFLVRKSHIVSVGINHQYKTHPLAAKYGHRFSSIHSEIHALSNWKYGTEDCVLLNIRLDKWGNLRYSEPCQYCKRFLDDIGLSYMFSTENGFIERKNEQVGL